jgi:hypothetical protein
MSKEMGGNVEGAKHEQLAPPPKFEAVNEKPKLTAEQTETISRLKDQFKSELESLQTVLSEVMKADDPQAKEKMEFFREYQDQLEAKLGLTPEKLLEMDTVSKVIGAHPDIIKESAYRKTGLSMENPHTKESIPLRRDPIHVNEDGSFLMNMDLELSDEKKEEIASLMKELPSDVGFVECQANGGSMLEYVPGRVENLSIRPSSMDTFEQADAYSNQLKSFLQQERNVKQIVSTGEDGAYSGGAFSQRIGGSLNTLPVENVKLKVSDEKGHASINRTSGGRGNGPLAQYLRKVFPK